MTKKNDLFFFFYQTVAWKQRARGLPSHNTQKSRVSSALGCRSPSCEMMDPQKSFAIKSPAEYSIALRDLRSNGKIKDLRLGGTIALLEERHIQFIEMWFPNKKVHGG